MSNLERVRKCGRVRVSPDGLVSVRESGSIRGMHGLHTCASIWCCPVCNAKVMTRRALEIQAAVALAQAQGLTVGMVTLTMRHHRGQSLVDLWDSLSSAWRRVSGGRGGLGRQESVSGYCRATEVTHGRNGWHVHVHVLVFLETDTPKRSLDVAASAMWTTWSRALKAAGLADPLREAQEWHVIDGPADEALSRYLTKSVDQGLIGLEMASTQTKHARTNFGTVTPWHLLSLAHDQGDADAFRQWSEWEHGSKGRRQISWSREIRRRLGLGVEATDEEIAGEEIGTAADDLLWILPEGWSRVVAKPELIPQILECPSSDLSAFLSQHHVDHLVRYPT